MPLVKTEWVFVSVPGVANKVNYFGGMATLISHLLVDMKMPSPQSTFAYLATALRNKHPKLAYLHVVESRKGAVESNNFLREIWNGGEGGEERIFISAGGYTRETALRAAESHKGELVAFGRLYVTNVSVSDLVCVHSIFTVISSPIFPFAYEMIYPSLLRTGQSTTW